MRNKTITHFSYLSLLATLVAGLPTYADEEETLIEEVVVTGSRIKSNANSAQPVTSFTGEDLNYGGQGDIAEILNDNPALLSSVTAANSLDSAAANLGTLTTSAALPQPPRFGHGANLDSSTAVDMSRVSKVRCCRHLHHSVWFD